MASVFKRGGSRQKGPWYAQWVDHHGRRKTKCTRTTDKASALRIANKHEADAALRREGVVDPAIDAISQESKRSIESHLADYENKLRTANRSEQYVRETLKYVREIATANDFANVASISATGVTRFAGELKGKGRSARTIGAYLTAIKGFAKWLVENQKLPRNPLLTVKIPNPKTDRRRERRALLPEEWQRLEATTQAGPERFGMAGADRVLLYKTAIQTGLRSGEIRSLTRGSLYLDATKPYIVCKARSTKNRKIARQHILRGLADSLRTLVATKAPKASVFDLPHESNLARMLRDDLAATRRAWLLESKDNPDQRLQRERSDFLATTNDSGESLDFHALRHTCATWLAQAGENPKTVQSIMRHSTVELSLGVYGHLAPGQEAEAMDRMGELMASKPPEVLLATGTDDMAAQGPKFAQYIAQHAGCGTVQTGSTRSNASQRIVAQKIDKKPLEIGARSDPMRPVTMPSNATAPLAQLAEQLTLNQ